MNIHGWKFEKKRKVDCSKRPSEKEKEKKNGLEQKKKK